MRPVFEVVNLLYDWHMKSLGRKEQKFIASMHEAFQGIGEAPNDNELKEGCGITEKQIKYARDLGKRYLIK